MADVMVNETWSKGSKLRRVTRRTGPAKAKVKVPRADRPTYDRCAAAMMSGHLYTWALDGTRWDVQTCEGGEWQTLDRDGVNGLLDVLTGTKTTAPAPKVRTTRVRAVDTATTSADAEVIADAVAVVDAAYAHATASLPGLLAEYVDRLVYPPKRAYADAYARHMVDGDPCPDDPGAEWAEKVRTKVERLTGRLLVDA